jgi:hypothetical protein
MPTVPAPPVPESGESDEQPASESAPPKTTNEMQK